MSKVNRSGLNGDEAPLDQRPRVLLLDANQQQRWLLTEIMRVERFLTTEAADTDTAVQLLTGLTEWKPTVVVMELRLDTEPDGLQALSRIQQADPRVQVVVYTDADPSWEAKVLAAGALRLIRKGTRQLHTLLAVVRAAHRAYEQE